MAIYMPMSICVYHAYSHYLRKWKFSLFFSRIPEITHLNRLGVGVGEEPISFQI